MNEQDKKKRLAEIEARAEILNRILSDESLNRIGNEGKKKPLVEELGALWKEYQGLLSLEELGSATFYPVLVYQSDKLGVSLVSRDQGKHWEVITLIDLGLGHRDTKMTVEAENGIPRRLTDTVPNVRFRLETKRVMNIELVGKQPKPDAPKIKPDSFPKLPSLTTCLNCGQSHMDNDPECPLCHKTREEALGDLNKKEKKGFLTGIVEALKK